MTDDKGSVTVMTLMFFSVSKRGSHGSLHAGASSLWGVSEPWLPLLFSTALPELPGL